MDAIWTFLKGYFTLPVLLSVVRAVLKAGGMLLVTGGILDAAGLETAIGAVLTLVGLVWGMANAKKKPGVGTSPSEP